QALVFGGNSGTLRRGPGPCKGSLNGYSPALSRRAGLQAAPRFTLAGRGYAKMSGRSSGVEHDLAKVGVEGSNPFARSSRLIRIAKRPTRHWCRGGSGLFGAVPRGDDS